MMIEMAPSKAAPGAYTVLISGWSEQQVLDKIAEFKAECSNHMFMHPMPSVDRTRWYAYGRIWCGSVKL